MHGEDSELFDVENKNGTYRLVCGGKEDFPRTLIVEWVLRRLFPKRAVSNGALRSIISGMKTVGQTTVVCYPPGDGERTLKLRRTDDNTWRVFLYAKNLKTIKTMLDTINEPLRQRLAKREYQEAAIARRQHGQRLPVPKGLPARAGDNGALHRHLQRTPVTLAQAADTVTRLFGREVSLSTLVEALRVGGEFSAKSGSFRLKIAHSRSANDTAGRKQRSPLLAIAENTTAEVWSTKNHRLYRKLRRILKALCRSRQKAEAPHTSPRRLGASP